MLELMIVESDHDKERYQGTRKCLKIERECPKRKRGKILVS